MKSAVGKTGVTMKHRNIMFDVDGVLADFVLAFTTLANAMFPEVPITSTAEQESWVGFRGMTQKQIGKVWERLKDDTSFWLTPRPLVTPEDFRRIAELSDLDNVYFVTSRVGVFAKEQTADWLMDYGIVRPTVVICKNKGEFAKAVEIKYSIEDKASNASCIAWITQDETQSYLLDRPYNQVAPEFMASSVVRVPSVSEYLTVITKEGV